MSCMRSKNSGILIVAGIIIIGGLIGVAVYFATSVHSDGRPSDQTTTEPETTTDPGITDPTTDPENTEPEPIDPPITLLFASTTDGRILRLDQQSGNYTVLVHEDTDLVKTFEYYRKTQILFYGTGEYYQPLKSWNEHKYSMKNSARWMKTAMAIDYVTERIYVLDGIAEKLYVLDRKTDYYGIVLTDLDEPRDVVIDSERRRMFILQNSSILSADLVGRHDEIIGENDGITAFAIDRKNGTLYYADKNYIRYFKYAESMTHHNLVVIKKNILSMAVLDDKLFYISTRKNGTDKALNFCYLSEECGVLETVETEEALLLSQIKSYDLIEEEIVNPCAKNNSGCEHLCIPANNVENYVCQCNAGWQLNNDSKTCSPVEDYLMYVQGNKIKGRTLGDEGRSFVDMDLDLEIWDAKENQDIYFDYDSHRNMLVYAYGPKVHYRNLPDRTEWHFEDDTGCEVIPVIDWVSKNLYNIKNCNSAEKNNYFSVRKLYETSKNEKGIWNYARSMKSFVVLPNQGKVLSTLHDESVNQTVLHMGYLNSLLRPQFSYEAHETGLAVDFEKESIYYLMSAPVQSNALDFDLSDIQDIVNVRSVKNPKSIGAFQGQLYIANATQIWRFGKSGKNAKMMMRVNNEIQRIRVYSKKLQPIDAKNPCAVDNGGCQRYCFAVPIANEAGLEGKCGCNDVEYLNLDNKTCSNQL